MHPAQIAAIMGGTMAIGQEWHSPTDLMRAVRLGLPLSAVQFLLDSGRITAVEMDRVVLPRRTLANRRKSGRLTAEQSDRLMRVVRLIGAAEETFGSREKADIWLRRGTSALAGERPLDLLDTDEGARAVQTLLGRIAHGIAA